VNENFGHTADVYDVNAEIHALADEDQLLRWWLTKSCISGAHLQSIYPNF
jgi:hypothetical protein